MKIDPVHRKMMKEKYLNCAICTAKINPENLGQHLVEQINAHFILFASSVYKYLTNKSNSNNNNNNNNNNN